MTDLVQLLPLALLGAVLGLDVVSFPQAMISRPLVAATAAALLLGDPVSGLLVGATLEMFALETLPFGASRYPEWGSAAVVGGGAGAYLDAADEQASIGIAPHLQLGADAVQLLDTPFEAEKRAR